MALSDALNRNAILGKVHSLEDSLKCKVCKHLLTEPLLILKCGHSSCKSCFARHRDLTCPVCEVSLSTRDTIEDKQLKELLSQLQLLKKLLQSRNSECDDAENAANEDAGVDIEETVVVKPNNEKTADARPANEKKLAARVANEKEPVLCSTPKVGKKRLSTKTPPFTPLSSNDSIVQQTPVARTSKTPTAQSGRRKSSSNSSSGQSPASGNLNKKNHKGETLLHRMVIKGDINRVRELIKQGASVNTQDNNGWTPLHEASNRGNMDVAALLCDSGALVNVPSAMDSVSPLHDALLNNFMQMALLLVARGADPHAKMSSGYTAFDLCRSDEDRKALAEACSPFIDGSTIMTNLSKVASEIPSEMVLLASNLTDAQKVQFGKCASLLKAVVVEDFKPEVTHIVTSCDAMANCTRTMKILLGMLTGKWIMNFQWIEVCLEYKQKVDEEVFEVQGTKNQPNTQGPKKGRLNYEQKFPPLFSGLNFYLHGPFNPPTPNREELCNLIHLGGGRILSREPRPFMDEEQPIAYHAAGTPLEHSPNLILYQDRLPRDAHVFEGGVCTTQVMWVIQCISQFKLLPAQQTSIPDK